MERESKVMDGGMKGIESVERAKDLLDRVELKKYIASRCDEQGIKQLLFHMTCALTCIYLVKTSFKVGISASCSWALFIVAELAFGVVASFYFNGFHEAIHGSAFKSKWMNTALCHFLGFLTFRGARWYWYFHWAHHRFTNDPKLDPELEDSTVDRADPLANPNKLVALCAYARFLSGFPFGAERIPGIFRHAIGGSYTPEETFVKTDRARCSIREEYRAWVLLYAALATMTVLDFFGLAGMGRYNVGAKLWYYWLLPHMIGAAHLRYYQTAEHRSCARASYTDTSAWAVSRTTTTWAFYCKLAWNMPYHAEHHSWPNIPFHSLPAVHADIKKRLGGKMPESGCDPDGSQGYCGIHLDILRRMLVQ